MSEAQERQEGGSDEAIGEVEEEEEEEEEPAHGADGGGDDTNRELCYTCSILIGLVIMPL